MFPRLSRLPKRCRSYTRANRNASITTSAKPFYVTTPIFYPNASPHIGHLYTLVTGDVFARYHRLRKGLPSNGTGRELVHFLAGTDEHGLKIQRASQEHFGMAGREQEFCDSLTERFRYLGKKALISNTSFMRTTSQEHQRAVEDVWNQLRAKNYIYKTNYSGWYSVTDECFYTDSQVTRVTSPLTTASMSDSASNPITGAFQTVSIETGSPVEWSEEQNYVFRLSSFRDDLLHYYRSHPRSIYPEQYREDTLKMLGEREDDSFTLTDISISRPRSRLGWGIQVPNDPSQTVYVWFDALLIYLTGSGYPWSSKSDMGCWPADLQIIGKDILRFHAIYLPAILQALSASPYSKKNQSPSLGFPLSRTILAHAHWTSSKKKMSKSLGNVADPLEAIENWGADVVRFYLMRVGGRWKDDVDWSPSQLDRHHREIQAQFGNYFLRITSPRLSERVASGLESGEVTMDNCFSEVMKSLLRSTSDGRQPEWVFDEGVDVAKYGRLIDPNLDLLKAVLALPGKIHAHMETFEVGLAVGEIMAVLKLANKTFSDIAPWSPDTPPTLIHTTRVVALETAHIVGACLEPIMPTVSGKLRDALGVDDLVLMDQDRMEMKDDRAQVLWDKWTSRKVNGIQLF